MKRRNAIIFTLLCAVMVGASTALVLADPSVPKPAPYMLRDYSGKIALFENGKSEPTVIYNIYTQLLPSGDTEALRYGIEIATPNQLNSLLEDLGA